jgi:predicted small integral membrane protein
VDTLADHIGWMAWTWQTVVFFASIAAILVVMTLLAIYRPETPHVGILGFATTRSDRLFVSLLAAAFVFLGFIRFGLEDLIYPVVASLLIAAVMFRFA